ncbi:MAG TPA: ATP-binding cassette domain-containing protein [Negativicutes bacterium]|nr:ATP-binding cassette domain-containing protein [Negativicutes bacterium]
MNWYVKVDGLTKRYGPGCPTCLEEDGARLESNRCPDCSTVWALRDVSFALRKNEILAVVGESGAGKSHILDLMYLNSLPTEGKYYFREYGDGLESVFDANDQEKQALKDMHIGIVYQDPKKGLDLKISSGGNIVEKLLAAGLRNVRFMRDRGQDLLTRMELPDGMDRFPSTFSSGMQQRVQIAKALANNPSLLLLDEPTTGLDVSVQARTIDIIKNLQARLNIAVLIVTHDLAVARVLADRIIVMKNGRIVEQGLADRILDDPHHAYTQLLVNATI